MNILVAVDKPGEISILSKYGANEFFCGYVPETWIKKYNKELGRYGGYRELFISLNRREKLKTNVESNEALRKIVIEAEKRQVALFLTLNGLCFPEQSYPDLINYLDEISDAGIRNIIITDMGLILLIKEKYPHLNVILSTCQQVNNTWTGKLFCDLGIKRITFPRHMTVNELSKIMKASPEMEYECFILEGKCIYDDGNCKVCHNIGGICTEKFKYEYFDTNGGELGYPEYSELCRNEDFFFKWTNTYPVETTINGWRNMGCAICTIPALLKIPSLKTLKISARGLTTRDKAAMVNFVSKAIELAEAGAERSELIKLSKETFSWPELCDNRIRCLMALK